MNSCSFVGRLTRDPEVKQSASSGKPYARFTLAVQESADKAHFLDFVAFGAKADFIGEYFAKGGVMAVTGRATQERWKADDGTDRTKVSFIANEVSFVQGASTGKSKEADAGETAKPKGELVGAGTTAAPVDDIPF